MLHIKSNSEAVVGVDTRSGTARALGSLEFVSGSCPYEVDPNSNNLTFENKWTSLAASHRGSQVGRDNKVDSTRSLTVMSFSGLNTDVFLDINTKHPMRYYGFASLNLHRNGEQHLRETDAFSIRVEHLINSSILAPGEKLSRPSTLRIPSKSIAGETQFDYEFEPRSFTSRGWDYIQFFDQTGAQIDRMNIDTNTGGGGNSAWIDFYNDTYVKDGIKYYVRDVFIKKIGTVTELRKIQIYFTTSGLWTIKVADDVALAYKNLATGKLLRLRFVFSLSPIAPKDATLPIPLTFLNDRRVARPSVLVSSTFTEDGMRGTFKFNRQAYVSAYINGVQVTDRVLTTPEGEITINFNRNVNEGSKIDLRLSTVTPTDENIPFAVTVADTVAPPPITASLFTSTRIFGAGGNAGDIAVAMRDDVEIGRATIGASLEYLITVNEGVTLTTGEIVEVYAMDAAGNKSPAEIYEIDVAQTTDGVFNPNLGNDALSSLTTVR